MAKNKLKKKKPAVKAKKRLLKKISAKKNVIKKQKRVIKKLPKKPKAAAAKEKEIKADIIGIVTHYFPKVRAGVIKLKASLAIGEAVRFKGHTTDFKQVINSIQVDHAPVSLAKRGQEIGILADSRVRQHDIVYKV